MISKIAHQQRYFEEYLMKMISTSRVSPNDRFAHVTTYWKPGSLETHAIGFLELAALGARHSAMDDCTAPATMYCIRHAVELFVKHVYQSLCDEHKLHQKNLTGHELANPWQCIVRPLVVAVFDDEAEHGYHSHFDRSEWLSAFDDIVKEVDSIDPDGQTLRYPWNKDGKLNLGEKRENLDEKTGRLDVNVSQLERFSEYASDVITQFRCRCT